MSDTKTFRPQHIISLDTETGGFNNKRNALLSIGIAHAVIDETGDIKNFNFKKEWHISNDFEVVKKTPENGPAIYVTEDALAINKIDLEDFKKNGVSLEQAENEILDYINSIDRSCHYSILGQNLKFDLGFILTNMPRLYNRLMDAYTHHELRSMSLVFNILSKGFTDGVSASTSMDKLRKELHIESEGQTHSALVDAIDNIKVFSEIQKIANNAHGVCVMQAIREGKAEQLTENE
jgi:DNA polymerase III epsilon subunit-like protein